MDLKCKKCGRWLGHVNQNVSGLQIKCGNCKLLNLFKIVFL